MSGEKKINGKQLPQHVKGHIIIKMSKYSVQSLMRVRLLFEAIDNFTRSLKTSLVIFTNKCICFDLT